MVPIQGHARVPARFLRRNAFGEGARAANFQYVSAADFLKVIAFCQELFAEWQAYLLAP